MPRAVKKGLKTRILEIVAHAKDEKITEIDLKRKLVEEGLMREPTEPYYSALKELVQEGRLGMSSAVTILDVKRGGAIYQRHVAVRVFNRVPQGVDKINELLKDLGYDLGERRFDTKLEQITPSWISVRMKRLTNILEEYPPSPSVVDFLISASADERFLFTELKKCLIHAVENATEKNVVPFLEKMNKKRTVAWLENAVSMSLTKMEVVDILHKLKNSRCVDLILEDLKESDGELCGVYGEKCAPVLARVFESFPERKSEVKLELSKILEKKVRILSPGGETPVPTRFRVAEAILERI